MNTHAIRLVVSGAFALAIFASAGSASAQHRLVEIEAPRDFGPNDQVDWTADLVSARVETTDTTASVTGTIPEGLNYIFQIELLLSCSDGSFVDLWSTENMHVETGTETRSCPNGSTIVTGSSSIWVWVADDSGGETEGGEPEGGDTDGDTGSDTDGDTESGDPVDEVPQATPSF